MTKYWSDTWYLNFSLKLYYYKITISDNNMLKCVDVFLWKQKYFYNLLLTKVYWLFRKVIRRFCFAWTEFQFEETFKIKLIYGFPFQIH